MFDSYDDSGNEDIQMFFTGGGGSENYKWHYIAVPDDGVSTDPFTDDIGNYNLLRWNESDVDGDKMEGWWWFDGYDDGYMEPHAF